MSSFYIPISAKLDLLSKTTKNVILSLEKDYELRSIRNVTQTEVKWNELKLAQGRHHCGFA